MALPRFAALLAAGGILAACSIGDIAPTAAAPGGALGAAGPSLDKAPLPLTNDDSLKFTFVIQPNTSYDLAMGTHRLTLPAGAICDIASSGYGVTMWNAPCASATTAVTITAKVHGSTGGYPVIEFAPALRFSPATDVLLYMYVKKPKKAVSNWDILYCATSKTCVSEDSPTYANMATKTVFRRIKHFSGYMVSE